MANLYDVTAVWNRRMGISVHGFTNQYIDKNNPGSFFLEKGDTSHYNNLLDESQTLINFIHYLIEKESVITIGSFFSNNVNKLIVLDKAKECGLNIPESYIITNKKDLIKIQANNPNKHLITKAIYEGIYRPDVKNIYQYYSYVERITSRHIHSFPDYFYPSLIQIEIEKELELRIFYIHDFFFPMAIFSQDEKSSIVDFRKNNHRETPLKFVPYKLPKEIELRLTKLMHTLKLNTGSIDMILNKEGKYVFLEVNPCGQYGMTSMPCNYLLDRLIARLLCNQIAL
jgi:ATP-GRASP peptide maturase of grasp-with-spasm system